MGCMDFRSVELVLLEAPLSLQNRNPKAKSRLVPLSQFGSREESTGYEPFYLLRLPRRSRTFARWSVVLLNIDVYSLVFFAHSDQLCTTTGGCHKFIVRSFFGSERHTRQSVNYPPITTTIIAEDGGRRPATDRQRFIT